METTGTCLSEDVAYYYGSREMKDANFVDPDELGRSFNLLDPFRLLLLGFLLSYGINGLVV